MEVRHLAHPLRSSIDLRSDIYTNQKAQTPVSTTGPCVGQMHKHIRGILWREQPAPETVHRGTKVAPEWRLDGYVWKPSLWKSSLSSLIPRLGRCITALRTPCHAKGMLKSGAEKLLRKIIVIFRGQGFSSCDLWKVKWSGHQTHPDDKFIHCANVQDFVSHVCDDKFIIIIHQR